ncbi:MAG TPA: ComEC/Rec2 family competence protein [Candidatus Saccharimonadales bacterium]|jgi:competence protein ComEC|nr:ComEC/Rec2 family competence protein [Candidatus Saccharimonadales bacterium]
MRYLIWPLLILLIVFRYFTTRPVYKNGDTVRITATVYSDPVNYPGSQGIKIGGLRFYLPVFPEISYGDRIIVEGTVDSGKLKNPKLISVTESQGFGSGFRNKIISFYQTVLPQPMSGLIAGITLGSKGTLASDFWQQIKNTGIVYMISASGIKVTFLVSFLMGVLTFFLPRKKAIIIVIIAIIMYLFISGFGASPVRAAVMAFLAFFGQETGRLVSSWRILFLTAGIMLAVQPDWLTDIGFALSFVSIASIMLFNKRIERLLKFIPEVLKESLSISLSAQIGLSPILFVTFGQFNIWSPLINVLVLWTVPFVMILGSLGGVVGLMWPFLGRFILLVSYPLLWWFCKIVSVFS